MKLRFLLALLLLTACNAKASGPPSTEKSTLLQAQSLPGALEKENKNTSGLVLFLWASALPVTLICSYEVCRSIREREASIPRPLTEPDQKWSGMCSV